MKLTTLVLSIFLIIIFLGIFIAYRNKKKQDRPFPQTSDSPITIEKPQVPNWHKSATIYEVNLRHYTPEGNFKAFETHLPRLKEMGIDILWLMPIHSISLKNRKGELGSPYAVADYKGVNPDFGSLEDFRHLLKAIHDLGMYCIIDWVPNHSGWDNIWIKQHPDWYTKDKNGNITDPINPDTGEPWGWTDVADLNYNNPEMRKGMIDAMTFWIKDIGIDGFRVDVAHGVPADFWEECTNALYAIKPIFMLAEAEIPALLNSGSFVMDYGWEMHHLLNEISKYQGANQGSKKLEKGNIVETKEEQQEKKTALDIDKMLAKKSSQYKKGYQMQFTSNHDENSWSGTEFQRMGAGHQTFAVLTATFNGMPLLYTGMESAMDKQLEFFKKDEINWGDYAYADFYKTLFDLKHQHKALWNGKHGGNLVKISTGNDENIYAFIREKDGDRVVVLLNLSAERQTAQLVGSHFTGDYKNAFSKESIILKNGMSLEMQAWEYVVLHN